MKRDTKMQRAKGEMQNIKCKMQNANISEKVFPSLLCLLQFAFCPFTNAQTLTLQDALQSAYKNHPTIQQNDLLVQQQQALVKTANTLDPFSINGNFGQANSKAFDYNIAAQQPFRFPTVIKADRNVLEQKVNVLKAAGAVTKNELTRNVTAAYYNWLYSWKQFYLLNELDSTYSEFEKYANKKYAVGETGILEKTNAKAQLSIIELQKKSAQAQINIYQTELQQWMMSITELKPPTDFTTLPKPLIADTTLLQSNSLLLYNQQQIVLSKAELNAEKTKSLPSPFVGINTLSIDNQIPFTAFTIGANVPLFKNGVKAKTKAAQFGVQAAEKENEKNKWQLNNAYKQAYLQFQKAQQQLNYYQTEGLQYASIILNAANKSYKAGDIGYIEYVQNIKEAISLKANYLQAINDYNQAVIQINYLLNK